MSVVEDSPSAERRKALKEADATNQLRVLGSCPLPKYIDIADRLLDHFQDAVDGRRLDEAYIFGLRFANLCLSCLPQHPEWKHDTSSKGRKRLTSQVGDVLCMMDVIKQRMDAEELMKMKAEMIARQEENAREKEAEDRRKHQLDEARHREQKIRDALKEERSQFLAKQRSQRHEGIEKTIKISKKKSTVPKNDEIEKSALAKLQAMQSQMTSMTEDASLREGTVADSKKNTKEQDSITTKAKKETHKISFGWGKKKSNLKSKDVKAILPSKRPTQPSKTKDIKDDTADLLVASIVVEEVIAIKNSPDSTVQQDDRGQNFERKPSIRENTEKKRIIATSAESQEIKVESENNEKKATIASNQDNEIESSLDTSYTKSSIKSHKKDSDSTRPMTSKKSAPINFIKSKILATKSSISITPSTVLLPPAKILVNDSIKSTTDTIIAAQQTPRSRKEKATIDKLKRAISIQEDRLEEIEGKQIPSLLHTAKSFLKEDKKQEALKCLAHKKRLERQVDTIKAAVFNMETQMFMLESTFEDRHVKKALDEAATAIAGFQQNICDPNVAVMDLTSMSASLLELNVGDSTDEELMEELEQWLSPEDKRKSQERKDSYASDDDISLLSMPAFLPAAPVAAPISQPVDQNINAAIAE